MPRLVPLLLAVGLLTALLASPSAGGAVVAVPGTLGGSSLVYSFAFANVDGQQQDIRVLLHLPPQPDARLPLTVLVALHGYGGNGGAFSLPLLAETDRLGWAVVAPTIQYRDWHDPALVCRDARDDLPGLRAILRDLPGRTGLRFQPRALLYGFSRGAQFAHRFALAYPQLVAGVAAMSAGTYTLPQAAWREPNGTATTLNMPYGVSDLQRYSGEPFSLAGLRQVPFWIGVGANDHESQDVPRNWDQYIGDCRVDRATAFVGALQSLGVSVRLQQFANTSHVETDEMRAAALEFLRSLPAASPRPAAEPSLAPSA